MEGGTSDARNSHIFNIFALVDIGERSGTGLADLYGHWKKYDLPEPAIAEEYDPDGVKITVYTDSDQDPTKTRPRTDQSAQSDPRVTQGDPSLMQDLPAAVKQVYRELVQDPKMTLRGLATKLGFSKTTVTTAIGILVANKIIRREGNKQTGHWEVVK